MKGFDTAARISATNAEKLKSLGYDFAIRYLVPTSYPKALTKYEAKALCDAGLRVGCVYETTASRASGGASAGLMDGKTALQLAKGINVPTNAVIYFAVDYDAQTSDYDKIAAYMIAAATQIRPYRLGVYGCYSVIEEMHRREIGNAYWQCVGWSGGKVSEHLTIYQREWNVKTSVLTVDNNYCDDMDAAGLWKYEEQPMIYEFTPKQMGIYYNAKKKRITDIQKELNCDIICNLNLFNGDWSGACYTRADGVVVGSDGYEYYGFGFDRNDSTITRAWSSKDLHSNFFGCWDLIVSGEFTSAKTPDWTNGQRRRTVIGTTSAGRVFVYANTTPETVTALKSNLTKIGAVEAVVLDGGGSTQLICPNGTVVSSDKTPRKVHTLFWANLTQHKKVCPYKEPTGIVKFGTVGDSARWAQWMLVQAGYDIGSGGPDKNGVDGIFGIKCVNATKKMQQKVGFLGADVDGKIGPKTKPMMRKEAGL